MFVGRRDELDGLERLYGAGKFQCVAIYGRRHIGKTALISEFVKDKEAVYFTALETNAKENLENFSRSIFTLSKDYKGLAPRFSDYGEALEAVFSAARERRVVLVIDEYPYLASSYAGLASLLQSTVDRHRDTSQLFIILCGASVEFMETHLLGNRSPMCGRMSAQFKIPPLDYAQAKSYFGAGFSGADTALLYGITGGIPLYMSLIDRSISVADNIKAAFLSPSGYLFEEPGNLVKLEFREPAQYNAIIKAVARGASKLSEISRAVGLDTALCSAYVSKLISIGVLNKERPFGEDTSRRTLYALADGTVRFWYRYVSDNITLIQRGGADIAYALIEPDMPAFMRPVFEEICKQYLWRLNLTGRSPVPFNRAGRWWGNYDGTRDEFVLDIIAGDGGSGAIFCACEWTDAPMDTHSLDGLIGKAAQFEHKHKYYYLFSKSGFTENAKKRASQSGNITLAHFDVL
jgi:AAA+ ATPase superfamily predicted ATPase